MVPKAGLEPATTRVWSDNPILRPVVKWKTVGQVDMDGVLYRQESNLLLPDLSRAFYPLNYDNRLRSAQRNEGRTRGELGTQPTGGWGRI